jgi:hypothetical protein
VAVFTFVYLSGAVTQVRGTVSVWENGLPQNMASEEPLCGQYQCGKAAQIAFLASDCIQYYLARQRMTYLSIFGWSISCTDCMLQKHRVQFTGGMIIKMPLEMIWHVGLVCTGNCLQSKGLYRTWRIAKYTEKLPQEKM